MVSAGQMDMESKLAASKPHLLMRSEMSILSNGETHTAAGGSEGIALVSAVSGSDSLGEKKDNVHPVEETRCGYEIPKCNKVCLN